MIIIIIIIIIIFLHIKLIYIRNCRNNLLEQIAKCENESSTKLDPLISQAQTVLNSFNFKE